jgi:hypothetical protein
MLPAYYAKEPPSGLLVIENSAIGYMGSTSNWRCGAAGRNVFEVVGRREDMGLSQVAHADHGGCPKALQGDLMAFLERSLPGK